MPAPQDPILVTIDGPIAIITLNLPHKLNALTADLYRDLGYKLREISANPTILITLLTGNGRYFSAGADIGIFNAHPPAGTDERTHYLRTFAANNLETTQSFFQHSKLLVVALNGPAVGLSAALISHADFIYATDSTFLLTPFTSLGLVTEGGSSYMFAQRLGLSKANEALILSKKIPATDLLQCGFLNKIYPTPANPKDSSSFTEQVVKDIKADFLERGLNRDSMLLVKKLIRARYNESVKTANLEEVFDGLDRFMAGAPQKEFAALASGEKKHKL
ncbi:ClpP/crotonase-like domain-containing protein [Peziza echinospora]|nr:ClpP/crotonase-like domain-containing protein [Peziza echinospora]